MMFEESTHASYGSVSENVHNLYSLSLSLSLSLVFEGYNMEVYTSFEIVCECLMVSLILRLDSVAFNPQEV